MIHFPQFSLAGQCASEAEKNALDIRALQTHLMVSALSCGEQQRYNQFIQNFREPLSQSGETLSDYFKRIYQSTSEHHKNRFITSLANTASEISLDEDLESFCDDLADLLDDAFDIESHDEIAELALAADAEKLHSISQCQ